MRLFTEPAKIAIDLIDIPATRALWRPESRNAVESMVPLLQQIRALGWVDAVIVRPEKAGRYELVDGERRLKAERHEGQILIDAVIVHAEDGAAAAITLLANLPPAELPAIHAARLVEWVREFDRDNGGTGTNAEVGRYLGCNGSTVSRSRRIEEGLRNQLLVQNGLSEGDLEEVPGTTLHRLASLRPAAKTELLRQIRQVKEDGGDSAACALHLATAMPSKLRQGRPARPFTVTDRSDGRFSVSIAKRPLGAEHARELLDRMKPLLLETARVAGVASLDSFTGLAGLAERPSRSQCTYQRMLLLANRMRLVGATKWQALIAALRGLMSGVHQRR